MQRELISLGLTSGEAKAYLALLKLGASTVGPIVKDSHVSYSKIYEVLGRLSEKGLVSYIIKEKTKYFQAVEPHRLFDFLGKRERELSENRKKLATLLPMLEHIKDTFAREESEIFVGMKGLRTAYDQLLYQCPKGSELLFFYVYDQKYIQATDLFYKQEFHRFRDLQLRLRGISTVDFKRSQSFKKPPSFIDLRFVDFPLPSTVDIHKDNVLFTSWREQPFACLIHSKEITENFTAYFESVWKVAKK